jgi:hypothetical protein
MNQSNKLLSDIVSFRTYAKYLINFGRREVFEETINRNMQMHLDKFPKLSRDIVKTYQRVHEFKVMPSMRALQFGGEAIIKNNIRSYNCSYNHVDDPRVFGEILFLLLSGTGNGYSVQRRHVNKLPTLVHPREEGTYISHDSIIGWAQSLDMLIDAYFYGRMRPIFDFSNIRSKGSYLVTTGARAPGPAPLKYMLDQVEIRLKAAVGRRLKPIEVHDIVCIIADCVLSGGIRRAALICLFDRTDEEMLKCKHGTWWEKHPYRARANNTAVLPRGVVKKEQFKHIYNMCIESNAGEPGFMWTNDENMGTNPSMRAGTKIWTKEYGIIPIEHLQDKEFTVKNLDGSLSNAKCWLSSPKETLYKLTLEGGFEYYCTDKHEWPVLSGDETQFKKLKTTQLETGMSLPRLAYQDIISYGTLGTFEDGKLIGYFYGDGWITDRKDNGKRQYGVCIPKNRPHKMEYLNQFKTRFNGEGSEHKSGTIEFNSASVKIDEYFKLFGVDKKEMGLPFKIWNECSNDFINGFIKGFLDADGHKGSKNDNRLSINSTHEKLMKDFQELLGFKGIYLNYIKSTHTEYTVKNKTYQKDYTTYTLRRKWEVATKGKPVKIVSIEKTNLEEPVWDITVNDSTHCFQIAGVITGNCAEISLNTNQFCNLTTINQTGIKDKKDWLNRVYAATMIGTMQAAYTDFPYLRPIWKQTTELEALLGVSCTGIADASSQISNEWLKEGAIFAKEINVKYSSKLGINHAARITTIKPEGTASCILGSSSGIHARHSEYYLRRVRMNKDDALTLYLKTVIPDLIEDDLFSPTGVVVTIPQESPKNAITREKETVKSLFERTIFYHTNWIKEGHTSGVNTHNVSVTMSYKKEEIEELFNLLWDNKDSYTAISLLPFDGGNYQQAPFEECTKETFDKLNNSVKDIDLSKVMEDSDNTNRIQNLACAGGACEVT